MASRANILDEYLVKLGFVSDGVSYARFAATLKDASRLVDNQYLNMAKRAVEFGAASVAAFASFGLSVLGIADKVAMADQEYRLLALHMYTSLPVARELKIALDALGQPLENVMWDPELAKRFHQLVADQQAMTKSLGPDFENQMFKIRDLRFEFTRLGVEVKYLTMLVVEDLAKAFGTDIDGLLVKFRQFNSFLIQNLPQIAQWFTSKLKPILLDVKDVMFSVWDLIKQIAIAFTNWVAMLSGDKSLQTTTANFEKLSQAIVKSVNALAWVTTAISNILNSVASLASNIAFEISAAMKAAHGDFKGALADLALMKASGYDNAKISPTASPQDAQRALGAPKNVQQSIIARAVKMGMNPSLALAVAAVESGGGDVNAIRQFDKFGKTLMSNDPNSHAMGMFQLQPGTAKRFGVDPTDPADNIKGGIAYLRSLFFRYGSEEKALEHYYGSADPKKNQAYAQRVLQVESGIHIGTLEVHVPPSNISADSVKWSVIDAIKQTQKNEAQRNLAEFQIPGFSY